MSTLMTLALCAFQASDAKAEDAFRRIEKRLRESKTLALTYRSTVGAPEIYRIQGSLHLAEGGKLNLDCRMSSPASSMEWPILAVSDGTTARLKLPTIQRMWPERAGEIWRGRPTSDRVPPRDLRERMLRQLLAFGLSGPALPRRDEQFFLDAEGRQNWTSSPYDLPWTGVEARELRASRPEDDLETLTFKVKVEGLEPLYEAKLWYDPRTSRLARRTLSLPPASSLVLTEVYEAWTLDGAIPPERFALPPKVE